MSFYRNKSLALVVLFVFFTVTACGTSASGQRAGTLDSIREQFAPLQAEEQPSPEPLESVVVPPREQPNTDTSFSQRVLLGQSAPFSGLLLSDAAAAFVASEYEAVIQRYELALTQQRALDYARLLRDTQILRLQINSERERFLLFAESQERHISSLEAAIAQEGGVDVFQILGLVGAGALGIIIGIVIGIFAGI